MPGAACGFHRRASFAQHLVTEHRGCEIGLVIAIPARRGDTRSPSERFGQCAVRGRRVRHFLADRIGIGGIGADDGPARVAQRTDEVADMERGEIGFVEKEHLDRLAAGDAPHHRVGEIGGLDMPADIEVAERLAVDRLSRLHRFARQAFEVPVRRFGGDIAVAKAARGEACAQGITLRLVLPALVKKGKAEPGTIAGAALEPDLSGVEVGEIGRGIGRAQPLVAVAVVRDDMARCDIGGDAFRPAHAVALPDRTRNDEEDRLRGFCLLQFRDDALRALVGGEEGTGMARNIVEAERDLLLRVRGLREKQEKDREPQPHSAAATISISTNQSLSSVCATIAVVGMRRVPSALSRAAALASA
eukprot:Opistho-2@86092